MNIQRNNCASSFEQDVLKLINLSRNFRRNCIEDLRQQARSPLANVRAAGVSAAVKNWSCITSNIRGDEYVYSARCRNNNNNSDTEAIITEQHDSIYDQMSAYGFGETVVPPIFLT